MSTAQTVTAEIFGKPYEARVLDEQWTPRFDAQSREELTVDVDGTTFIVAPEDLCDPR